MSTGNGFDRLAGCYRALEYLAFGRDLERARFAFLDRLAEARDILVLGEGDGRCVQRLAGLAPKARILCVDASPGMIRRARARFGEGSRVTFMCADALAFEPEYRAFDAVVTFFFLDCFTAQQVEALVARIGHALRPGASWLFADFVMPPRGIARLRARAWLAVLYGFFRLGTGLRVSALPPAEAILEGSGWSRAACLDLQRGLVRSAVYNRPGATEAPAASA